MSLASERTRRRENILRTKSLEQNTSGCIIYEKTPGVFYDAPFLQNEPRRNMTYPHKNADVKLIRLSLIREKDGNNGLMNMRKQSAPLSLQCSCSKKRQLQLNTYNGFKALQFKDPEVETEARILRRSSMRYIGHWYYPEGGWGWMVCLASCLLNILISGMIMSSPLYLSVPIRIKFGNVPQHILGILEVSALVVSYLVSPVSYYLGSTRPVRVVAVSGTILLTLGFLFTSFSSQFHQLFISLSLCIGVGWTLVRETSTVILNQYFKKNKHTVETLHCASTGVGILVMSPVCDFLLREQGWRLGLQMMCLILIPGIFICLFYRPASLYHPQRRAMQHIKFHQKRILLSRFNPADIGIFRLNYNYLCNRDVLLLLLSSALLSSGLWTPFFMIPQITISDKHIAGHITDLYLAFGISIFLGSLFSGILFSVRSSNCNIGIKNQVQSCSVLMGICICVYSCTTGYKGHMMFVVIYGLLTGSVLLSTKLFVYTQTRRTEFHTVWGLVQLSMGLPLLVSVLLSSMFSDGGYSFIVSGILVILSAVPIQWCHLTRLRLHTEKGMKERNEIFSNSKYIIKDYAAQNFSVKPVEDNNLKAEGKKENKKEIDENEKEDVSGLKEGKNEAVEMDEKILGNLEQFLYEDFITSCNKVENQVLQEELEQNKYIYSENQDVWAQNELVKQDVWAQDEFNIFLNKRRRYST